MSRESGLGGKKRQRHTQCTSFSEHTQTHAKLLGDGAARGGHFCEGKEREREIILLFSIMEEGKQKSEPNPLKQDGQVSPDPA